MLLDLKKQYKSVTGQDPPGPSKDSGSKKKKDEPKPSTTKQDTVKDTVDSKKDKQQGNFIII